MRTYSLHLQVILLTHRHSFCWLDEWFDLTLEEVLLFVWNKVQGNRELCSNGCPNRPVFLLISVLSSFLGFLDSLLCYFSLAIKCFNDQSRFRVQISAREVLARQRLKATVKQPPVIDPRTGQEVIIEPEVPSSQDTDDSDDASDIEAEYFEAEVGVG